MMRSEAENFILNWYCDTNKIFKYKQEFLPDEFIMIEKKDADTFEVDKKQSTYNLEIKDKNNFIYLLTSGQLIYDQEYTWKTPIEMKTGGCSCGQWSIKDGNHSDWCK